MATPVNARQRRGGRDRIVICYFLTFTLDGRPDARVSDADLARLVGVLRATPGTVKALVFTPATAHDPYLNDGPCPTLILESSSPYIAHHPPIMARFPGIREIEISTRVDWCSGLPWPRVECMQRNKVVFDNPAALTAALNSPVRDEMRADFRDFPPFSGKSTHYP